MSSPTLPTGRPDITGRSKKVWFVEPGRCVVEMIPSLRSFTHDRDELMDGTAELRLDFFEYVSGVLAKAGVPTVFRERLGPITYLADYRPAVPFEVIVKNRATGSTTRKYPGLFEEGRVFAPPVVKFDYRTDPEDQPIGEDYLRRTGVDVEAYRRLALACNTVLHTLVSPLELWDFCLVIAPDEERGLVINSEISPDCMRLRRADGEPYDKDLFRRGASREQIIERWTELMGLVRHG
ncbi:phosphoribosylaminoimidazolesuccinocarboxamide synthase [Salinispora arenicola]|uniref:SAICAR synthetase n=1 Tax=Salinispora arenicola (strain CNS-205) TaxID=391037 RepID=A8M140_SALAI|nr:phosphoribosylaminoimidazolesuccinocarboxamide synthase [Salinispora arenicola]MCN0177309.1 SAICAR synthetase [Salinispora arenicola]